MHLVASTHTTAMPAPPHPASDASDASGLLAGIRLQCPRCGTGIAHASCPACGFVLGMQNGIVRALLPESLAHYARFMAEYEHIREAEGRGSADHAYYLGLPYRDSTGRDPGQWRIRARSYNYLLRKLLPASASDHGGRLLDLGAGNGWMSFRLALAGYRPCAVDLITNCSDGMGAAHHYRSRLPELFPRVQADIGHLPFADGQFDAAVFNASFHYSEDGVASLREALRCVRPGGSIAIIDTPWYPHEEDGRQMLAERHAAFLHRHGTAADSIVMLAFLTDSWLHQAGRELSLQWQMHQPWYGLAWAMRPVMARLRGKRRPSKFRLYTARKPV